VALIEVRGLTKLYRMGDAVVHALDGVDLTIERGEFVAITGASGSGKSTMMHLLGCLDRPTDGTYTLDGRAVSDLSDRELAVIRNKQIGFVFQTFNLINRTSATENVGIPLFYARQTSTRGPSMRALERVGLATRAQHNPNELSGGERQRVAIARAIVNDPVLLLADEPTGNLDSRTGEQIMEIFRQLNASGVTIVMVTHEPDIARQARRIVQMRDGKITSDRPAAEVIAEAGPAAPRKWSTATTTAPAEEIEAPTHLTVTKARLMGGASAALICGVLSVAIWGLGLGVAALFARSLDPQALAANPGRPPPTPVIIASLGACVGYSVGPLLAILALVFAVRCRKRLRTEPGLWRGGRRALAGLVLGILGLALPVASVVVRLAWRAAR
jgi:putative ABC transport system ATP-binding protein